MTTNLSEPETAPNEQNEYLTKPEVARLLRVTERSVDNYMAIGVIPFLKLGRTVRFPRVMIQRHLEQLCGKGAR